MTGVRASFQRRVERLMAPVVPAHLARNWCELRDVSVLRTALETGGRRVDGTASGLADHVLGRLESVRRGIVPWLDDAVRLDGARVLEVGCGTGSTTVAPAEQGARVLAVDLLPVRVEIIRQRCAAYGVDSEVVAADAVDLPARFPRETFDLVVLSAVLEHMTLDERLAAVAATWGMVRPGAGWCVLDTPNRCGRTTCTPRTCRSSTGCPTISRSATRGTAPARRWRSWARNRARRPCWTSRVRDAGSATTSSSSPWARSAVSRWSPPSPATGTAEPLGGCCGS